MISNILSSRYKRLLNELDWDCQDHLHNKASLNVLHWYPASFITAIPGNIIDIFTEPGDMVWDPFCGSGTSALEAYRKGRNFFGNDISEIAILISNAKISLAISRNKVHTEFNKIKRELQRIEFDKSFNISPSSKLITDASQLCSYNELLPWYNEFTFENLLSLYGYLHTYPCDKHFKLIYLTIFLSVTKLACAQQKTWGHIADNVLPTKDQLSKEYNVYQGFIRKLTKVEEHLNNLIIVRKGGKCRLKVDDARQCTPSSRADIVITSPPYPSMADYLTSQRLEYLWLGYDVADINRYKQMEVGARFRRHSPKRNEMYLDGMKQCFANIIKNVKNNGLVVIVLPDFRNGDGRRTVIEHFIQFMSSKLNFIYKISRTIDENNRWSPFKKLKEETLYIWRKNE